MQPSTDLPNPCLTKDLSTTSMTTLTSLETFSAFFGHDSVVWGVIRHRVVVPGVHDIVARFTVEVSANQRRNKQINMKENGNYSLRPPSVPFINSSSLTGTLNTIMNLALSPHSIIPAQGGCNLRVHPSVYGSF